MSVLLYSLIEYIISIMHLEERLAVVKGCLEEGGSILFKNINSNRNPSDSNLLKTCYYHIKSLNQTLEHDRPRLLPEQGHKKENEPYQLPKISNPTNERNIQSSILPKSAFLLSKLNYQSRIGDSSVSLLKFNSSALLRDDLTPPEKFKEQAKKKKKPQFKHLNSRPLGLSKQQRFFENQPVEVSPKQIASLGYYEATNIYKLKNTKTVLQQLRVVASKPEFNPISIGNKHDLFLTNLPSHSIDFRVEDFIQQQLNKERDCEKVIQQCASIRASQALAEVELLTGEEEEREGEKGGVESTDLYITIKECCFVKDQSYRLFTAKHSEYWGDVQLCFRNIVACMRKQKISSLKVKADKLTLWGGKKLTIPEMTRLLGLHPLTTTQQKVETVCLGFLGRLRMRRKREAIQRQQSLARWVCARFKTFTTLRRMRRQKLEAAIKLHQELQGQMDWDTEIHLPSFSVQQFKRNTTQYLESFQNIYHSIWKNSNRHLVLILPTLNQSIIKMLQTRIRVKRSLTVICPELHQVFPNNLSLAAQVLFSYETLSRIQRAIEGRIAVLVPGCYDGQSKPQYQMLLSQHLKVPLLCSLEMDNSINRQKRFFLQAGMPSQPHYIIPPKCQPISFLESFCAMLMEFPQERKWIIKLQGQFKGRGVATIKLNPVKYFRKENSQDQNRRLLLEHLKTNFKLKLKINFQNSLYMVEDFIKQLHLKGGVIQEEINSTATYEMCFYKTTVCQFQYLYRVYGTDYSNKVWLSTQPSAQLQSVILAIQDQIQAQKYLGHLTVTICKGNDGRLYGNDLKLHQTYSSSMVSFIGMVEQKRALVQDEAASIHHLPTRRPSPTSSIATEETTGYNLAFQNYSYLLVPNLVFTDVQQSTKAKLIEQLMGECWGDRHVKIQEDCRLFLSMGVDFSMILIGKDIRRLKKRAIDSIRELNDRTSAHRKYRGKEVIRDVFQYGDIIRALSQIKD